jgi:hypothetical protein
MLACPHFRPVFTLCVLLSIIPTLLTAFIQEALKYATFIRVGFTHTHTHTYTHTHTHAHTHTHTRVHHKLHISSRCYRNHRVVGLGVASIVQQMKRNTEALLGKLQHDIKFTLLFSKFFFTFHIKYIEISGGKKGIAIHSIL